MNILLEVEKHRKEIITDSYTSTWRELINVYKDKELVIDPEYQRLFRWPLETQTRFIESLLLGIPSPAIFLAENDNGNTEILDGLQRFCTLLRFFSKEVFESKYIVETDAFLDENINNIYSPSILSDAPLIKNLEGMTSELLPDSLSKTIKNSRVTVILIKRESDKNARMEVFKRLNRYGAILSDQEIRNAMSMLYNKDFPNLLKNIAASDDIRSALDLPENLLKQMGAEELILRMLSFTLASSKFKKSISSFLDDFMFAASKNEIKINPKIINDIKKVFLLINNTFESGDAFRFAKRGFSTNLFDVIAIGVYYNLKTLTPSILKKKYNKLMQSPELKLVTGAGSNTKTKLNGRIALGKKWFK